MADISNIHEKVFDFLYGLHQKEKRKNKEFHFSLRKSNRYERLEKGYWFHGNEGYLALSFWSGFDYANKTPNLSFIIFPDGESMFEVVARDYDIKLEFIEKYIIAEFWSFKPHGHSRYQRYNKTNDYMKELEKFISFEKRRIDIIILENEFIFSNSKKREKIGFISKSEFNFNVKRTLNWREKIIEGVPYSIKIALDKLKIEKFGPIEKLEYKFPENRPHFIFITGENGGGKTSLLRAITLAFTNSHDFMVDRKDGNDYGVELSIHWGKRRKTNNAHNFSSNKEDELLYNGFAAYGPHRLVSTERIGDYDEFKSNLSYNIFNDDGILFDVWNKIGEWNDKKNTNRLFKRMDSIRETLHDLNEKLNNIYFPGEYQNNENTLYEENDNDGEKFPPVVFKELASGIRSIIGMFGDMMIRLFDQQPDSEDVADLTGVVLIDEVDLHLHPRLQKKLIEQLDATFPKIQFVISTHSPIPFLGAPKDSAIIRVIREKDTEVTLQNLDNIDFSNLLPNTILSSPIFGFHELFPISHDPQTKIRTETRFNEVIKNKELKDKVREIAAKLNEKR